MIGILSHYYNSNNYGGALQAYALCEFLKKNGFLSEQIQYSSKKNKNNRSYKNLIKLFFCDPVAFWKKCIIFLKIKKRNHLLKRRFSFFSTFRETMVPHTNNIYYPDTIDEIENEYDCFITGSDQVWNPCYISRGFTLEFVSNNKKKISYAASLGTDYIDETQKNALTASLPKLDAVSVREKESIPLLQPMFNKRIEYVLDPTLLLSSEEWDQLKSDFIIKNRFVFCYFLGNDKKYREIAKQYAKKNRLIIVNIPHTAEYNSNDSWFGDYKLFDASPCDFISLIKNADVVFTDSFHCCVFSLIYKKKFIVFQRSNHPGMRSRIDSLLNFYGGQSKFCDDNIKTNIDYIEKEINKEYFFNSTLFDEAVNASISFLLNNLDNQ